jgi:hypothetical protein
MVEHRVVSFSHISARSDQAWPLLQDRVYDASVKEMQNAGASLRNGSFILKRAFLRLRQERGGGSAKHQKATGEDRSGSATRSGDSIANAQSQTAV